MKRITTSFSRITSRSNFVFAVAIGVGVCIGLVGCVSEPTESVNKEQVENRLLEIAGDYLNYELVDPSVRVAPSLCVAPRLGDSQVLQSKSEDEETHGKKLYVLFAASRSSYEAESGPASEVGQVVVKEAWEALSKVEGSVSEFDHPCGKEIENTIYNDTETLVTGDQSNLFMMYKLDPETSGTDEGWVYGVVSPDKKTVLESGRITSCMKCHVEAGKDRLFGMAD